MYPVSARFAAALRRPHTAVSRVTVIPDGSDAQTIRVLSGGVDVDATRLVRRRLTVATPRTAWLDEHLLAAGTTITAERGIRYPDRTTEWVPLGVFEPGRTPREDAEQSTVTITAEDLMRRAVRARFVTPTRTAGLIVEDALRLADAAVGTSTRDDTTGDTAAATAPLAVHDRDRDKAIAELAQAGPCEVFCDVEGVVVARDVPDPSAASVWLVDAGPQGILLSGQTDSGTDDVFNTVVVIGAAVDGTAPFAPQVIEDTNPDSPTYVATSADRVPYFYESELIRSTSRAQAAGAAMLRRVTAPVAQQSVRTIVHPGLDAGDVITIVLPDGEVATHVVESLAVPLDVEGDMPIVCRSSRSTP